MNEMKLHVHQSFRKRFFVVGLMVLFAISFHSLAWLRLGLRRGGNTVSLLKDLAKQICVNERKQRHRILGRSKPPWRPKPEEVS